MFPQWFRETVLPRLDPIARAGGVYTAYRLDAREHVGVVTGGVREVRAWLEARGYAYNGLAAAKRHPETGVVDRGSCRLVPDEHPDTSGYVAGDARIVDRWAPRECQYHVHLFPAGDGTVELFSHYELRPDLLAPSPSLERLPVHYRPEWHEDYLLGVASEGIRDRVG